MLYLPVYYAIGPTSEIPPYKVYNNALQTLTLKDAHFVTVVCVSHADSNTRGACDVYIITYNMIRIC